uniref:Ubiq_cyt_C_chap domain-containing protein n=1 Tax=Heterorhabditis bacteriophora TaxID=37862 RepID=A0A1I7W6Y8_HETBA
MNTRAVIKRIIGCTYVTRSTSIAKLEHQNHTVDDVAQRLLSTPETRIPKALSRFIGVIKLKFTKDNIDPDLKPLLDSSSAQLYYNCANNFDYEALCEAFGLPDFMSSWYKLTLMHVWMVLMRMHVSLTADTYLRLQRGLLSSMWLDVDNRLKIVEVFQQELNQVVTSQSDMKHMHGLHLQTFLEYDEGFLSDDRILAAAIWRCLYVSRPCDPLHVLRVIIYIRSTLKSTMN